MKYTLDICQMQIADDALDLAVDIKAFDECHSSIEIKTVVNPDSWPELSDAILKCLKMIHPTTEPNGATP